MIYKGKGWAGWPGPSTNHHICVENMTVVRGRGGSIIFMNEVNCKLYEKEKGGLVGQAHQLISRCVWRNMTMVRGRGGQ